MRGVGVRVLGLGGRRGGSWMLSPYVGGEGVEKMMMMGMGNGEIERME